MLGYAKAEVMARPLGSLEREGGAGTARIFRSVRETGRFLGEVVFLRKDGVEAGLEISAWGAGDGSGRLVLAGRLLPRGGSSLQDSLMLLVDASGALLGSLGLKETLPAVLSLSRRLIAAEAYAVWRIHPDRAWRIECAFGLSGEFRHTAVQPQPGWSASIEPLAVTDVTKEPLVASRVEQFRREGIASLLAVPMQIRGAVAGIIAFYFRRRRDFTETETRLAAALANLAGAAISSAELHEEQKRNRLAAEEARRRAGFIAEASALLASTLDYETTLASVARLAVPHIADWCSVNVVDPDGALRQLAVAHADPSKIEWAGELRRRYPPDPRAPWGIAEVVRTGKAELVAEIPDALLARAAHDQEHLRLLREVGFTSYMCVPMVARGRTLGAIAFISAESGRTFGQADLELAEELARRAALAVDNAVLYGRVRSERAALERALAALRENEERLRLALDAGRMGIWDWNIESGALTSTGALAQIHGFAPEAFPATFEAFVSSALHPEDRAGFVARVRHAVAESAHFETEFRAVRPDGSLRWVLAKGQAFAGTGGRARRMIGLEMDITERRLLEEKLRDSQKLESVGLLAGGIAHDFNNLLTGILGNTSMAMNLLPAGSEVAGLLEEVRHAGDRAAELTRQLLAYSGKGRFVIERMDLSRMVRDMDNLIRVTVPRVARVSMELAAGLPPVEADPVQLQQVVMNLVSNAAEAVGVRPGVIGIRTGWREIETAPPPAAARAGELRPGTYVYVEVSDTGAGMQPETVERIFDPFFTTKFTGRGLGLAAAAGIARSHGGAIQVESAVGRGSTFRLFLPAAARIGAAPPQPEHPAAAAAGEGGTVLVIDDEEVVRRTAENGLRRYGYEVLTAGDGAEGVELFRARAAEISAVLLDMTMPVMSGEEALALIKQIRPDVPVVASSGYSETEAARRFAPALLAGFVQKPYTAAALAGSIRAALGRGARARTS